MSRPAFFFSAGAGHGGYFVAKILFPFTMLSTVVFGSIIGPFIALAIAQFPLYGLLIGIANEKRRVVPYSMGLVIIHTVAVIACFLLIGENFS